MLLAHPAMRYRRDALRTSLLSGIDYARLIPHPRLQVLVMGSNTNSDIRFLGAARASSENTWGSPD